MKFGRARNNLWKNIWNDIRFANKRGATVLNHKRFKEAVSVDDEMTHQNAVFKPR